MMNSPLTTGLAFATNLSTDPYALAWPEESGLLPRDSETATSAIPAPRLPNTQITPIPQPTALFPEQPIGFAPARLVAGSTVVFNIEQPGTVQLKLENGGMESRQVSFNLLQPTDASRQAWNGQNVWIVSHGWNGTAQSFLPLANAIQQQQPNDLVLTLDWSQAANTGQNFINGNFVAGRWISTVADFAAQKLREWGLSNGSKLNLVGHSLGALLSGELAARFGEVNTITALEPPSELNLQILGSQYDVDGNQPGVQRPRDFSAVSGFSRAFVGTRSLAASTDFSSTADQSILVDFNTAGLSLSTEHSRVIDVFTKLVAPGRTLVNNLFELDDLQVNPAWRNNAFSRERIVDFSQPQPVYEGLLKVDANNTPLSFTAQPAGATNSNDQLLYGSSGDDIPIDVGGGRITIPLVGGSGNDTLTGGAGADWFVFDLNRRFDLQQMGLDLITDFALGIDKIGLDKTTFTQLVSVSNAALQPGEFAIINSNGADANILAGASTAKIVFDSLTSSLYYNPNGAISGLGLGGKFATLTGVNSLSANDFVVLA